MFLSGRFRDIRLEDSTCLPILPCLEFIFIDSTYSARGLCDARKRRGSNRCVYRYVIECNFALDFSGRN
jgi:hypothetical protein